jgi:catechol 2,3-dioxygenase-like lactoylglutathione lyase family enzyme
VPASSHHVACITDDPEAVHEFLTGVVGLEVHLEFRVSGEQLSETAGWPPSGGTTVRMFGRPPAGIVEVIAVPPELRGVVPSRIWLVSFATADVVPFVERARRQGLAPTDPSVTTGDVDLTTAFVDVGGITWEFVRFG